MNGSAQEIPTGINILRWIARIWSALIIAFSAFVLIGHVFFPEEGAASYVPWYEYLMPVSMLISVAGLVIAWRRQVLGAAICIGFALFNLVIYIFAGGTRPLSVLGLVVLPVILPAGLFLLCNFFSQPRTVVGN